MQVTPRKVAEGWKFAIEVRDTTTNSLVSSANIITDEKEGAQIRTENNDSKSGFRSISLSFSPVSAKTSKSGKSLGAKVDGDMVTLNFTEPTNIKDIIKTMAQVSGKNIILNRDIDATVQVVSQHPISKTEAYKAFVSALELAGLEALDEGKAIRIVKKPSAG
jgi:general secretion pathway protein D